MKKKLVFHFYCDRGWEDNDAIKLHLACLHHYAYIFDDCLIVISTEHVDDEDFILGVKGRIIKELNVPSLTIKVAKNTVFREARTFYDEVVSSDYDGVIFFAHTKGYSNFSDSEYNKEYLSDWIVGAYWLSLNFPEEMESVLSFSTKTHNAFFYGSFLTYDDNHKLLLRAMYSGTFYWTNINTIKKELFYKNKRFQNISDRMFAEQFPGDICLSVYLALATGHNSVGIIGSKFDFYGKGEKLGPRVAIDTICRGDLAEFDKFRETIYETVRNSVNA